MDIKLNIEDFTFKKILQTWLSFLLLILIIYVSTETIVPKEFKFLKLNSESKTKGLKFDFKE